MIKYFIGIAVALIIRVGAQSATRNGCFTRFDNRQVRIITATTALHCTHSGSMLRAI